MWCTCMSVLGSADSLEKAVQQQQQQQQIFTVNRLTEKDIIVSAYYSTTV